MSKRRSWWTSEPRESRRRRGIGWFLWRFRWQLVPFWVGVAVPVSGWVARGALHVWGWQWVVAGYAVALLVAASWIIGGLRHGDSRVAAQMTVITSMLFSVAIMWQPTYGRTYGIWAFVVAIGAALWWWGPGRRSYRRVVEADRFRRNFSSTRVAKGGGAIVDHAHKRSGWWARVRLSRNQSPTDMNRDTLAHELDVAPGRLIVQRDPRSGRSYELRILDHDVFEGPPLPHPATSEQRYDPTIAEWAPGARSVLDPVPIGRTRDDDPAVLHLWRARDVQHGLIVGKTGSGKSNTLSCIAAHVAAARDAVLWASDVPKGGSTFLPWGPAVPWLTTDAAKTELQMRVIQRIIEYRCAQVARSSSDKWKPTPQAPAIVYVIEEAAALFSAHPDLAEMATSIILTGRQAAVALVIVSQGADWESIPTRMRDQVDWIIAHNMSPGALRIAWPAAYGTVDMSLFGQPGLLYLQDGGGLQSVEGIEPIRSYALYHPPIKKAMAEAYGSHQPQLDPLTQGAVAEVLRESEDESEGADTPSSSSTTRSSTSDRIAAARRDLDRAMAAVEARAGDVVNLPPGALADIMGSVPPEVDRDPADEPVRAAVLKALREAGPEGLAKSDIAAKVGRSPETVLRRLTALRAEGLAYPSGGGGSTRWHAVAVDTHAGSGHDTREG